MTQTVRRTSVPLLICIYQPLRTVLAIVLEAARRLGARHKMSITQIDHTGILPLTLGTSSVCGAAETASMKCVDRVHPFRTRELTPFGLQRSDTVASSLAHVTCGLLSARG